MAYTFDQIFAADPSNPSNIAQNAAVTIFAPGDGTMTPLTITDPDGQPLANPLTVNANGFASAFAHATLDRVAWVGGGFTGFFTSYEGMKGEAVAARAAAETAQTAATAASAEAASAGATAAAVANDALAGAVANAEAAATAAASSAALVNAPADEAIAAALSNSATATRAALNSALVTAAIRPVSDNQNLAAYGDSLTEPAQWINELLLLQPGIAIFNGGKSGQSSSEVAMRQGGLVPKVTVTGGSIPASGSVAVIVDHPTGAFKSNVAGAMANPQYVGTIAGVEGTLVANIQGNPRTWSFTRTTPGTAVPAPGQRYFVSTEGPLHVNKEQIFWTGRNFSGDRVITDTADMVAYLRKHVIDPAFTVISIINSQTEILGSSEYDALLARNATLKETYGDHYLEVRRPLIDDGLEWAGITPTAGDTTDIANDTIPRSLQVGDGFHLNSTGQRFVAKLIAEHRTRLGYDRKNAIVAANIGPDPVYVPPVTAHTISVGGFTHRYVAKTLPTAQLNTSLIEWNRDGVTLPDTSHLRPVVTGSGGIYKSEATMSFVNFDGVDDRMYVPAFTQNQPFTVAIVYRMKTTGGGKSILSLNNGTPNSPQLVRDTNGDVYIYAGGTPTRIATPGDALGWHVAYASVDGANTIVGVDGSVSAAATPGTAGITGIRIGQGATSYTDYDVAEIIIWPTALTSGQLATVRADIKAGQPALP